MLIYRLFDAVRRNLTFYNTKYIFIHEKTNSTIKNIGEWELIFYNIDAREWSYLHSKILNYSNWNWVLKLETSRLLCVKSNYVKGKI